VTARSAADLLGIQPDTAILFYQKIRRVISSRLEQDAQEKQQLNTLRDRCKI